MTVADPERPIVAELRERIRIGPDYRDARAPVNGRARVKW
jgi:hypothetical protein